MDAALLIGAVAIYIDELATGTRYTDAVIQAQFQRIKEELDASQCSARAW